MSIEYATTMNATRHRFTILAIEHTQLHGHCTCFCLLVVSINVSCYIAAVWFWRRQVHLIAALMNPADKCKTNCNLLALQLLIQFSH